MPCSTKPSSGLVGGARPLVGVARSPEGDADPGTGARGIVLPGGERSVEGGGGGSRSSRGAGLSRGDGPKGGDAFFSSLSSMGSSRSEVLKGITGS